MHCRHKWGEIKDGYQYCKKCNIAYRAPCIHEWKLVDEATLMESGAFGFGGFREVGLVHFFECTKCGKMKKEVIRV